MKSHFRTFLLLFQFVLLATLVCSQEATTIETGGTNPPTTTVVQTSSATESTDPSSSSSSTSSSSSSSTSPTSSTSTSSSSSAPSTSSSTTEVVETTVQPNECEKDRPLAVECYPDAPWLVEGKTEVVDGNIVYRARVSTEATTDFTGAGNVTFSLQENGFLEEKTGSGSMKLSISGVWLIFVDGSITIEMTVGGNLQPEVDGEPFGSYLEEDSETRIVEAKYSSSRLSHVRLITLTMNTGDANVEISTSSQTVVLPKLFSRKIDSGATRIAVHPCVGDEGTLFINVTSITQAVQFDITLAYGDFPAIPGGKEQFTAVWDKAEVILTFSEDPMFESYSAYTESGTVAEKVDICDMIVGEPVTVSGARKRQEIQLPSLDTTVSHSIYLIGSAADIGFAAFDPFQLNPRGTSTTIETTVSGPTAITDSVISSVVETETTTPTTVEPPATETKIASETNTETRITTTIEDKTETTITNTATDTKTEDATTITETSTEDETRTSNDGTTEDTSSKNSNNDDDNDDDDDDDDDFIVIVIIIVAVVVFLPLIILAAYFLWRHYNGDDSFKDTELDYMFTK